MKRLPGAFSPNSYSAFTLLEVLVSSVILVIVMILLIGMADHTTRIWRDGECRRSAAREVRAGLEMITEDLHSAVITTNPASLTIVKEHHNDTGSQLFFLVSHPEEKRGTGNEGDLCAMGYFIAADPKALGQMNLYRFHASGEAVAKAVEKGKLEELYSTACPTNFATTELLARHLQKLEICRIQGTSSSDKLMMISLFAPRDDKGRNPPSASREDQQLHYSTIVRLPPLREQPL